MEFPLLLALITIMDILAMITARYYIEKKNKYFMTASLILAACCGFFYVKLMEFAVTAIINVLYAAISTVFVTLFYFFVFKERLTKGQWVGIGIALVGVVMLEI